MIGRKGGATRAGGPNKCRAIRGEEFFPARLLAFRRVRIKLHQALKIPSGNGRIRSHASCFLIIMINYLIHDVERSRVILLRPLEKL